MRYLFLFCACAVVCFQSSCISIRKQIKEPENKVNSSKSQELIGVNSLLLRVPKTTVLKMGLLGNSAVEFSPAEAEKLLGSLKRQPGVEQVSFNSCAFVSGEYGSFREVTEHNSPTDKKSTESTDFGRLFIPQGAYNSSQNTINLTFKDDFVIMPETPIQKSHFTEERIGLNMSLIIKNGHTLLVGKLLFPYNSALKPDTDKYLLFFITAECLGSTEKFKKASAAAPEKMVNINALSLIIPKTLAAKWGLDGMPSLNPEILPLKRPIPQYLSPREKETLLSALLKLPEVQITGEHAITMKDKTEGAIRYIYSTKGKSELGLIIRMTPKINDKNTIISFNFSPTAQTLSPISPNDISVTAMIMPVRLEDNHTLLLKNTLSNDNKNISLCFITAKIVGDNGN